MMKVLINESGPDSYPRLDHENFPSLAEASRSFGKESTDVGHVVHDIREYDRAERSIGERYLLCVEQELHRWASKNLGGN